MRLLLKSIVHLFIPLLLAGFFTSPAQEQVIRGVYRTAFTCPVETVKSVRVRVMTGSDNGAGTDGTGHFMMFAPSRCGSMRINLSWRMCIPHQTRSLLRR